MIFIYNKLILILISSLNKFGRGLYFKKKLLDSRLILDKNFEEDSSFSFIQIGANDGISFDFLYDFVIKRKSKGVVIEPVKEYFKELVINYKDFPKILKVNKAVHPFEKKIDLYKINNQMANKYPEWAKGIASLNKNHHKKINIKTDDIIIEPVEADTLMEIIHQNYNYNYLDYFQVDTEGFDYEIIKMLDFSILKPRIIKFESVHLNSDKLNELNNLLRKKKYYLFTENGDTVALNLRKIKLL